MRVDNKKVVTIEYTLADPSGKIIDSSKDAQPLAYIHGAGGIIPGLEVALAGKDTGESIQVTVQPDQGYGQRDSSLVQTVPRTRFPAGVEITSGMQFQAQTPQGARIVTVVDVDPENVKVDANHPLAGIPLHFDVTIVDVRDATPEEISHGHVHGPGGHQH